MLLAGCRVSPSGASKVGMEVIDHGDEKSLILIDQDFKTRVSQSSLLLPK